MNWLVSLKKSDNLLFMAVLCVFSVFLGLFLYRAVNLCGYPFPLENGEGICVHFTQLLKEWNLYKRLNDFPLIVANYPPFYFIMNSVFWFSNPFISGRLISVLSILGSVFLLYKIIKDYSGDSLCGVLSATVFLILPWASVEGIIYRVDMLASVLSLAGFYFLIKSEKKYIITGIVFLILGLYTKHTVWAGAIGGFSYLFFKKTPNFKIYLSLFFLSGIGLFLLMIILTDGEFYNHLIKYNIYNFGTGRLLFYVKMFLWETLFLMPVFLVIFTKPFFAFPFGVYCLFALLSLALTGRDGSSRHYFFEASYALCLSAGYFYGRIKSSKKVSKIFLVLIFLSLISAQGLFNRELFKFFRISDNRIMINQYISNYLKNASGPILAEDPGFIISADKTVYAHTFAISKLIEKGVMNPSFYYGNISNKFFSVVMLDSPLDNLNQFTFERFTIESLKLININYQFRVNLGGKYIYIRR